MTAPHLLEERRGHVLLLTLNRPEARNAISPEMACRLADAFARAQGDAAVRAVVLTGAGDRAFCSGGDLRLTLPLMTGARAPEDEWDRRLVEDPAVMERSALRGFALDVPVLSAINGACLAGGAETVLATDLRVAAPHATFGLPEVRRALIPFAGSLARLPREVSHCRAMELLLLGEAVDAEAALRMGLLNAVVPAHEVLSHTMALAERIARNGPLAVREIKRTVREARGRTLAEGFALEDAAKARIMASADAREGPLAFMEKREPVWRGE